MDKRVDLSKEFTSIHDKEFLKDIGQVAKRKSEEAAQAQHAAQHKESNKLQTIIIACATVVLIVVAFFVVFGNNKADNANEVPQDMPKPIQARTAPAATAPTTDIASRRRRSNTPSDPNQRARVINNRASAQGNQGYEQPQDSGM